MLDDVELLSGFRVTGKIVPFFTEIKVQGDSAWLAACTVYLANPNSAHGHRVSVVAVNAESARAGAFTPTSFTHARLLNTKVSLSAAAMAAVADVEKILAQQTQTTRTASAATDASTLATRHNSDAQSPRRLRAPKPKQADIHQDDKVPPAGKSASKHSTRAKPRARKPAGPWLPSVSAERKQIKSLSDQLNLLQTELQLMKQREQHDAPSASSAATRSVAAQAQVFHLSPLCVCLCVFLFRQHLHFSRFRCPASARGLLKLMSLMRRQFPSVQSWYSLCSSRLLWLSVEYRLWFVVARTNCPKRRRRSSH